MLVPCRGRGGTERAVARPAQPLTISVGTLRQWLVLDVRVQPVLNAIQVEVANPAGDGVRLYLDLGMTLDLALRLVGSAMRLRGILTP